MANRSITIAERIERAQQQVIQTKKSMMLQWQSWESYCLRKRQFRTNNFLRLFVGSCKSYEEVAAFLKEGIPEEQLTSKKRVWVKLFQKVKVIKLMKKTNKTA